MNLLTQVLVMLLVALLAIFLDRKLNRRDDNNGGDILGDLSPKVKHGHLPPVYYGYKTGTFDNSTKCDKCGLIGLYEDLHPANPCPLCGGKVTQDGPKKWVTENNEKYWKSNEG